MHFPLILALFSTSVLAIGHPGHSHKRHSHGRDMSASLVDRHTHGRDMAEVVARHASPSADGEATMKLAKRRMRKRRSCRAPNAAASSITPSAAPSSTKPPVVQAVETPSKGKPTPATPAPVETPKPNPPKAADPPKAAEPLKAQPPKSGGGGGNGAGRPSNWPKETQVGSAPASTVTTAADPLLKELSKSYNNAGNGLYSRQYEGEMTFYGQGLGACGDTYDDSSYTAAVSKLLYDQWPGASSSQNLNPICGPFVPGRKTLSMSGKFETASNARGDGSNFALIGGDGRINCDAVSQCHVPLTATVTHRGKSIVVSIVDRCEGCAEGDIDLTPTAFAALADPGLGRTEVSWKFNQY